MDLLFLIIKQLHMKPITGKLFLFLMIVTPMLFSACTPKTVTETAQSKTEEIVGVSPSESKPSWETAPIPVDESVRMGTLPNGMKYYIKQNAKPEKRVELRLAVNAGSILEDDDQKGLAHFVEHMAFNGSANFKKNELVDYLESVGTKFGPDLNAYTSFDETVYMLQTRTDDPVILGKGLTVIQDWAGGLSFDHAEIDKERGVVESEWRTRLSPDQRMQNIYFPIIYQGAKYAQRLPIGDPETILHAPYDAFKRFYQDWYRPDLMSVVIVGDVDVAAMEAEVKKRFSDLKNPASERAREEFSVPKHKETLVSIVTDKEAAFTRVQLMYKHPHKATDNLGDYRRSIVQNLYNGMLGSRLQELAQQANPPYLFAYSGYGSDVGDIDSYESFAMTPEGGAKRGLEVVLEENERVLRHGFTATEFERQKVETLKNVERAFKEKDKTESDRLAMSYVYNYLDDNPIPSPEQRLELYKKFLPTITLQEVNALAKQWITDENRVVVLTGPEKKGAEMPSDAEVRRLLDEVKQRDIQPYVDKVNDGPLLAADLKPVAITGEKQLGDIGVTELALANGVRVVLKPTDFKNDEVLMQAYSYGGTSLYADADYPSATNAASVIDEAGVGNFDLNQLQKKLSGKKVNVSPFIRETTEGFNGSASPDDLETLFELTYLYFTEPRKDETALQAYTGKQKSIYKNILSNPTYYFMDQVMRIQTNNHPRRGFPTAEQFDAINLGKAFEIYKDRFADAADFTFIFVGNFDVQKMKGLAAKYLGNLPSTHRKETWKDVKADMVGGKVQKAIEKGEAPKSEVNITYHGDFNWDDAQARYDFNAMTDVLRIKMRESMREDKGGVYGVRVSGNTSRIPKGKYSFTISFNCDPGREKELIETAMADIAHARKIGADEKDLLKVKETQRQERIKDMKENRFWMGALNDYYSNGLDPIKLTLDNYEKYVNGLSADAVKKMANKVFNDNNRIEVVMTPAK